MLVTEIVEYFIQTERTKRFKLKRDIRFIKFVSVLLVNQADTYKFPIGNMCLYANSKRDCLISNLKLFNDNSSDTSNCLKNNEIIVNKNIDWSQNFDFVFKPENQLWQNIALNSITNYQPVIKLIFNCQ